MLSQQTGPSLPWVVRFLKQPSCTDSELNFLCLRIQKNFATLRLFLCFRNPPRRRSRATTTNLLGRVHSFHHPIPQKMQMDAGGRLDRYAIRYKRWVAVEGESPPYSLNTYSTYSNRPLLGLYSTRIGSIPAVFHTYSRIRIPNEAQKATYSV